jgi:endonuclease/exonuclease/phosphatase (EEP) superfamily protein YafD
LRRGLGLAAFVVLVVAGAGTLLGFAARYGWRLELASHFRVQYLWALAAAAFVLALVRWRKAAAAAIVLAAVNLVLILPLYHGGAREPTPGQPLRAMSFNVHYLNEDYGSTLELIVTEQPDFFLLVEITDGWADALHFLKPDYPHKHELTSELSGGLGFYSKFPIVDLKVHQVPGVCLPTIVAVLDTPQGRLTVVGTHPASPQSPRHFELRNSQLAELAQLAQTIEGPVLLLGDLNCTSWSPFFQELLEASELRDSRRGFGVGASWPWFPLAVMRIPIDHCLVSADIAVSDRWVGPAVGSDHRPIVIEFSLAQP